MTVKDMDDKELIRQYYDSKSNADYYYKRVKEIEKELMQRGSGKREN